MKPKSKGLGKGFRDYLDIIERLEKAGLESIDSSKNVVLYGDDVGPSISALMQRCEGEMGLDKTHRLLAELVRRWGADAMTVRDAFKFKTDMNVLVELATHSPYETNFTLPFKNTLFVLEDDPFGLGTWVILCEERIFTEDYEHKDEEMRERYKKYINIEHNDTFYCLSGAVYSKRDRDGKGWHGLLPLEVHIHPGVPLPVGKISPEYVPFVPAVPDHSPEWLGDLMNGPATMLVNIVQLLIRALAIPHVQYPVLPGIKPGIKHKRTKKRNKYVMYEHTTLTIEPLKQIQQKGPTRLGGKHRAHAVRSFYRTMKKTGKRVLVREHWRGNKDLGVVTHDYDIKT